MKKLITTIKERLKDIEKIKRQYGEESNMYIFFTLNALIEMVKELENKIENINHDQKN